MDDVVAAARQASSLFHAGRFEEALAVLADIKQRRSDDPKARARTRRRPCKSVAAAPRGVAAGRSELCRPPPSPPVALRRAVCADARRRHVRR
jgi:hypothetical protein